jgi:hypothetical protein
MPKNFRLAVLLALCAALGWPQLSPAQTATEFFGQKTIKFVITYEPGGSYDLYARLVTMHLPKHLAGHPAMVMQYMPGAGGLLGTLHFHDKAAQDGSELAILPRDIAINQMLRPDTARYDARRFNWIGTLSSYIGVMFVASRTGVKNADDLRRIEVVAGSWGITTETYITPTLLNALAGTRFKIVTGYRGGPDVDLAVERGEVDGRMSSWTLLKTQRAHWLANGTVTIPFQAGLKSHPELAGVPLIASLALNEEGGASSNSRIPTPASAGAWWHRPTCRPSASRRCARLSTGWSPIRTSSPTRRSAGSKSRRRAAASWGRSSGAPLRRRRPLW